MRNGARYGNFWVVGLFLLLSACTSITRQIQASGNDTSGGGYPAAVSTNSALSEPPSISLTDYKSVHTRPQGRKDIAIVLAASGGGYRAANLTLGVLMGLERLKISKSNFLQQIDYFSTVSGGGFGVGYYLVQLHNHLEHHGYSSFSLNQTVQRMLASHKQEENTLRTDLSEHLFFGTQRGLDFETTLNRTLLNTPEGGLKLGDMYIAKDSARKVQLPYWAVNTTIYQNAAIFPFSPDVLARYKVIGFAHNNKYYYMPANETSLQLGYDMPVSVGLTASASVPFALPTTTLTTRGCDKQCYLQLLDGGLSDNLGVYTALNFLYQDPAKIKILIVVDAYKGNIEPYSKMREPPETLPLFWRVVTVGTDSNREQVKPSITFAAPGLLCSMKASNVIVIYLDIARYPEAQKIGTQFSISAKEQQTLLKVGQDLVLKDPTFKKLLAQLKQGKLTLGRCNNDN